MSVNFERGLYQQQKNHNRGVSKTAEFYAHKGNELVQNRTIVWNHSLPRYFIHSRNTNGYPKLPNAKSSTQHPDENHKQNGYTWVGTQLVDPKMSIRGSSPQHFSVPHQMTHDGSHLNAISGRSQHSDNPIPLSRSDTSMSRSGLVEVRDAYHNTGIQRTHRNQAVPHNRTLHAKGGENGEYWRDERSYENDRSKPSGSTINTLRREMQNTHSMGHTVIDGSDKLPSYFQYENRRYFINDVEKEGYVVTLNGAEDMEKLKKYPRYSQIQDIITLRKSGHETTYVKFYDSSSFTNITTSPHLLHNRYEWSQ